MIDKDFEKFITNSLAEDLGDGDHSSLASIPSDAINKAHLLVKDEGIIAGVELAKMIFNQVDASLKIETILSDGDKVKVGDIAFIVEGKSISILTAERLVLNCMQHMSAIATKTNYLNSLISDTKTKLLDTRKTTPLNRKLEKWAVKIGGGVNHRFGLFDMIMIKDNHIDYCGSIKKAVSQTKDYLDRNQLTREIEVEVRNLKEVKEAMDEKYINRIMLDNFSVEMCSSAVELINGEKEIEISGGIDISNIRKYALSGIDFISSGSLTHSAKNLDLNFKADI